MTGGGSMIITDVRPWGGPATDLVITDGVITAIGDLGHDHAPDAGDDERLGEPAVLAGAGAVLLPAFSDVHVHLDSTRLGLPYRPNSTPGPTLWDQIMNDRDHWRSAELGVGERATLTLGMEIAHGATRIRSYAQVDADCGLEKLAGVLAAREAHRDRASVEVMAFPQAGLLLEPGVAELMAQALAEGADVVGGIDPCGLDADPVRHLDVVFGLADRFGVPVDIHLHEAGELGLFSLGLILDRTEALGLQGRVTISHAFCLGSGLAAVGPALERIAGLDVAVATVAPARSPLPMVRMAELGIRLGLGQDGQRDYWSPYGNADMLDRCWQLAFTQGFRKDELIEHTVAVGTVGGASIMELGVAPLTGVTDRPGLAVGDPAELVLIEAESVAAAVLDRPSRRTVLHAGRVVARDLELAGPR